MIRIPTRNLILILPPKTASQSLMTALLEWDNCRGEVVVNTIHALSRDVRSTMPKTWKSAWVCGFIRNPWEWYVSAYSFARISGGEFFGVTTQIPFWAFVEKASATPLTWFTDAAGNILVENIFRIEDGFEPLYAKIGETLDVPTLNVSKHGPYRDYYDRKLRKVVAEKCAREIELFGYEY